jgi:hypothetical protein
MMRAVVHKIVQRCCWPGARGRRGGGGRGWGWHRHRRRRLQQGLRGQPVWRRRHPLAERKQKFIRKSQYSEITYVRMSLSHTKWVHFKVSNGPIF